MERITRFDSVKYDDRAESIHRALKKQYESLEGLIVELISNSNPGSGIYFNSREIAIALTKLEESFVWIGKALKEETLKRKLG